MFTKKKLFEKLVEKTKGLGHQVSFSEMKEDPAMPDPNLYAYYYGSFSEAAIEAYRLTTSEKETKKSVVKKIYSIPLTNFKKPV